MPRCTFKSSSPQYAQKEFCADFAKGASEDFVVGRLGLTIETPLTAPMVDVGATDVLNSTTTLHEVRQRFLEARSIALFEAESARNCG
jgi:hypothetical protein